MLKKASPGDVVVSTAGRDKDKIFLVAQVDGDYAYLVDGKIRKISLPKKKSLKHIKVILPKGLVSLSEEIKHGAPVGAKRLKRALTNKKI